MTELKTLKDIGFEELWEAIKKWDIGKFYPEEKVKNLIRKEGILYSKTTGTDVNFILDVIRKAQKQEAIKWIKKMKEMPFIQFPEPITKLPDGSGTFTSVMINKEGIEDIVFWIKYFFNITEEDLE